MRPTRSMSAGRRHHGPKMWARDRGEAVRWAVCTLGSFTQPTIPYILRGSVRFFFVLRLRRLLKKERFFESFSHDFSRTNRPTFELSSWHPLLLCDSPSQNKVLGQWLFSLSIKHVTVVSFVHAKSISPSCKTHSVDLLLSRKNAVRKPELHSAYPKR